ncbi:ammonia-dependent NAD(+) synthetase [Moritella sp. F3]|uniref:ammonia-dependent NAD(+) synthetase n=1 Tax=Moritella sp. F3 TaxID=2718882 RepID=UPI0018E12A25|nr:ammonia-dependent NAD(+) synthetase [Moritella sp. F3]GIC78884.1 NH(3)-dependent NAD(+) synthetase [Moritella sp. F1]GIC83943.1 NH(3)-dependent NAD(+) synthetase [Moritella sp. F3]
MTELRNQIIAEMKVKPSINIADEIRSRINFIKQQLTNSGLKSLVLGISGGVDSSTCGRLCQLAIEELNTEQHSDEFNFIAVRLPYSIQADEDDAQKALSFINPKTSVTVNIQSGSDSIHSEVLKSVQAAGLPETTAFNQDFNKGNVKARMRMIAQYEIAGLYRGLVPGTDHSAENISGFFTKHGDGACDLAPLFGLNKRQVRALAEFLGASQDVFLKIPTADLEEDRPQLEDEIALGVTYDQIDDFLEGKSIDANAEAKIIDTYSKTTHKRNAIPTPT